MNRREQGREMRDEALRIIVVLSLLVPLPSSLLWAGPTASSPGGGKSVTPEEMEVQIKGQFKGRLLIKKIVAPVTMNLEKLQDFPEDPSQKILLDPLPISQSAEFNARSEVKGHAPFVPWIPAIAEPPFLRLVPPKIDPKKGPAIQTWMFEIFNPQG